ncbi:MAG: ribbon-helix-helix protein, CopG family [Coleofasciculaceae cyanobacterium SM2_3_26]|nr:ribbon-helix-helix protein, CopG family [Coleofasciculaceae cyanobacterium SM2_3_26]
MARRKTVSFRVEEELWEALQRKAESEGVNVTRILNRLIEEYLNRKLEPSIEERLSQLEIEMKELKGKLDRRDDNS